MSKRRKPAKQVETLTHKEAKRKNIPTVEYEPTLHDADKSPISVSYERRNKDLDPQLVWRGKDEQDWSDLVVQAPPLYIQEKIHPKAIIDDLKRQAESRRDESPVELDLFADFNGLGDAEKTEFYQHEAELAKSHDPGRQPAGNGKLGGAGRTARPSAVYIYRSSYGIKFNSNWQVSTRSRDVKDSKLEHVTREPEQVKAFRDTWRHGIHSYLTYLRNRLTVARDLLAESGSVFVQIGDENVHRVRTVMDEVFGDDNLIAEVVVKKTTSATSRYLAGTCDYILWAAKNSDALKYHQPFRQKKAGEVGALLYNRIQSIDGSTLRTIQEQNDYGRNIPADKWHLVTSDNITSQSGGETTRQSILFRGESYKPASGGWKTNSEGMKRLNYASRLCKGGRALRYIRRISDFPVSPIGNVWEDMLTGSFTEEKRYVVQTAEKIIQRCILMVTDPGDLVLDPTCGSGTTAYVAEQWGAVGLPSILPA